MSTLPAAPARPSRREGEGAVLFVRDLRTYFYLPGRGRFLRAVDGVRLAVKEGETLVLVGESGSGKSVTVLSLMGLVSAAPGVVSGRIWYRPPGQEDQVNLLEGLDRFARFDPGPPLRVEKDNRRWLRWHEAGMRERRGRGLAMIFQKPPDALPPYLSPGPQIRAAIRRPSPRVSPGAAGPAAREGRAERPSRGQASLHPRPAVRDPECRRHPREAEARGDRGGRAGPVPAARGLSVRREMRHEAAGPRAPVYGGRARARRAGGR